MRIEKKATVVSTTVAGILVAIKMTIGMISGSVAVLASAIDSLLDLAVSAFNYFALSNAEKAPDEQFNFGRTKIEPLAAVVEGTIISLSALFIFYEAMDKIFHRRETTYLDESIAVMVISIVITALLVVFLNHVARKTGNMVIKADALHYKTDLYSNGAVLLGLGLISVTAEDIIDPILGIAIAGYMIYSAYPIIKEGVLMLLDVALNEEDVLRVKAILDEEKNINGYHFLQTRQSGSAIFISVHLEFSISASLFEAHRVADNIELKLKQLFPDNDVQCLMHMDPYDDSDINEQESDH